MKKLVFCLLLLLFVSFAFASFADNGLTHYIPEKEVSVFVPFDILCISREADETNAFFQNEHFDYERTHEFMLSNNMYLYGMTSDSQGEFSLTIVDYSDVDFNTANELILAAYEKQLRDNFVSQGLKDVKSEIYQGSKDKVICVSYTYEASKGNQYVKYYFMTHASDLYGFRFISFFNPISESQDEMIKSIVDSVEWGKKDYTTDAKGETDINIYTDYETGLSFMVPSGWSEVKFVAGDEGKKVKYRIGTDNVWVLYESGDLWDVIQESYGSIIETYGMTRADFDNTFLSEEMISNMLGCTSSDKITLVNVGTQEYYCVDKKTDYSSGELVLTNHDLVYICMQNGYLYWFQLSGLDISKYEDQFSRFLKTVEYP